MNRAVQPQKMARSLKFRITVVEGLYYPYSKKALISCTVTAQLICVFVFAYAKIRFSHDEAHIVNGRKGQDKNIGSNIYIGARHRFTRLQCNRLCAEFGRPTCICKIQELYY